MGIGIDVVEPQRMQQRLERRPSLREELFSPDECAYCDRQAEPYRSFAARFAAKEAVVKALQIDGFEPREIEIVPGSPAPTVRLFGDVAARAAALGVDVEISLTHIEMMAAATAITVPHQP